MIDHDGAILSVYDKLHLVPFGEYLPFQDFLERLGLMQLTKVRGGYIPGTARKPIAVPRAPRVPAADLLRDRVSRAKPCRAASGRAGCSTSPMTAGSASSSGPYQHLQQARVRAIEEGLPLVRAANTGISAVIDPLGRIVRSLPLGTEGVLDAAAAAADRTDHSTCAFATVRPALVMLVALRPRAVAPAAARRL